MSILTLNGAPVTTASITIPYYGAWSADLVLPTDKEVASPAALIVGDVTLVGTVVRQGAINGDRSVRLVGGGNGWSKELPAKGYSHVAGVKLSTVLNDCARQCGERIEIPVDRTLGTHYVREKAKAERALALLQDGQWWVDNAGVTQLTARTSTRIATPFTVVDRHPALGSFEIATEFLASWVPGRTFSANTVPDLQTISSVSIESGNEGKLRLRVLTTDTANERLLASVRAIVRAEIASLEYAKTWEYQVAPSLGTGLVSTLDCTPTDDTMPPLTGVPIIGLGAVAAPLAGTSCRIRLANGDPTRPEVVSLGATTEHLMTTEACALLIYNTLVLLMNAAGGGPLTALILQPLLSTAIAGALAAQSAPAPPGLIAQALLNTTLGASMASGTTPSNVLGPLSAGLAGIDAKTLNVSGFCPGIGVPNE